MNYDEYQLVVVAFDGKDTASDALDEINKLRKDGSIRYKDAVAAYKKNGKVKLAQTKEKKGILGGGIVGLLAGIVLGGPILGAAVGALAGGAAFKGMSNKELKEVGEDLGEDESALFLLVEEAEWDIVEESLPDYEALLYREVVPVEVIVSLENASANYEMAKAVDDELAAE